MFLIRLVGAVLAVIVTMGVAKSFHSTWASLLPIGLSWVVFCLMLYWLAGVGRRNFEEFRHGFVDHTDLPAPTITGAKHLLNIVIERDREPMAIRVMHQTNGQRTSRDCSTRRGHNA